MEHTKLQLKTILATPNVAKELSEAHLTEIGQRVLNGYAADCSSRGEWEQRMGDAIKLALQIKEAKTFPWTNASNIKFPLLTIASLQFLARVSLMTKGKNLAKVRHVGMDDDGVKSRRAKRISQHLSLQLVEEDKNWLDSDEQAKLACSILGSAFKKTYFDSVAEKVISEHVPAMDFVVDYHTKDIDQAHRATHVLRLDSNALQERARRGVFCELRKGSEGASAIDSRLLNSVADEAQGTHPTSTDDVEIYTVLEQHCWEDLDGDGYKEPYVVSVRQDTGQVLRIVARFTDTGDVHRVNDAKIAKLNREWEAATQMPELSRIEKEIDALERASDNLIVRIDPRLFFTRYLFIPSPDGGVYGLGLGSLLGPLNHSVDTLVNQLVDAGTMSNTAGGFLGRGVKIKSGKNRFDPFEWKPVDSTGNDLKANIFPLPVREPSMVLFQLLGMLVTYSEKISGATDIMTGISPGQNTPAETSRNTVEQGMMLFSGIYNRLYRGFQEELRKFYKLNGLFLVNSARFTSLTEGESAMLMPDDYDSVNYYVYPAASPEAVSQSQMREKAAMLMQLSGTMPGFDRYVAMRNFLEAHDVEDIDLLYPHPQGPLAIPQGPDPKAEAERMKLESKERMHGGDLQVAIAQLKIEAALAASQVKENEAQAMHALARAQGVDAGHRISLMNAQVGAAKAKHEGLLGALNLLQKKMEHKDKMKTEGLPEATQTSPESILPELTGKPAAPATEETPAEAGPAAPEVDAAQSQQQPQQV